MILVVGGFSAGKRDWVSRSLGYGTGDMTVDLAVDAPVLYDIQDSAPTWEPDELLPRLLKREVIICNEVGCGIVPINPEERANRERVGRLCVLLAQHAKAVVRVYCGIGTVIKGELP